MMLQWLRRLLGIHDPQQVIDKTCMALTEGFLRGLGVPDGDMPAKLRAAQQRRIATEAVMVKVQQLLRQSYDCPCNLDLLAWYADSKPVSALELFEGAYQQLCAGDDQFVRDLRMYQDRHNSVL